MRFLDFKQLARIAEGHLNQAKAWSEKRDITSVRNTDLLHTSLKHLESADLIIGMMEVEICGSIGGYDEGQTPSGLNATPYTRLEWIKENYIDKPISDKDKALRLVKNASSDQINYILKMLS